MRQLAATIILSAVVSCDVHEPLDEEELRGLTRKLDMDDPGLDADQACFDPLGRLGRCFLACNYFNYDTQTSKWHFESGGWCRFACIDTGSGDVVSCGHHCDDASQCRMALMESDLVVYEGGAVPDALAPLFEDGNPYLDVEVATSLYSLP